MLSENFAAALLSLSGHAALCADLGLMRNHQLRDDVAEVIARTRFFAARYAHRDAAQKAFSRKGWARLTWRQRCRSLERVTGVAAPTFHAALGPRGARTTPSLLAPGATLASNS